MVLKEIIYCIADQMPKAMKLHTGNSEVWQVDALTLGPNKCVEI